MYIYLMGALIVCQIRQIFNLGLDKGGTSLGLDSLPSPRSLLHLDDHHLKIGDLIPGRQK